MNHINTAQTQATSGTYCWGEQFSYDIWGNLLNIGALSGYGGCTQENLSVSVESNNRLSGYSYDAVGNLLNDGSYSYTWNAEGQMATAAGVTYTYDGDGRRVKKSNGKLYWYGPGLDPFVESDLSGNVSDEYIFFNGKRVARRIVSSGAVNYYFSNHLGSTSVITSSAGSIVEESDYYPFGGERAVVNNDPNPYKFTGKERDTESGLDYFGARFYSSNYGRFASVDPSRLSIQLPNPQTWNRYAYVMNNPMAFVDPNGKWSESVHNRIIDNAFSGTLSESQRWILKRASVHVDKDQSISGSHKHGMRGLGQSVWDSMAEGDAFISQNLESAVRAQIEWERKPGAIGIWNTDALFFFGMALHTVTDRVAPGHRNHANPWLGIAGALYVDPIGSGVHLVQDFRGTGEASIGMAEYEARLLWQRFLRMLEEERKREQERKEEEERKRRESAGTQPPENQ